MEVIGPYRIVRKLGEGGMGAVYLAEDDRLRRRIALKVIAGDVASDPLRRARFEREARAAAVLSHPNICVVHDIGETAAGEPFIAMEYIDGVSLRSRLAAQRGALPVRSAVDIAIEIADALAVAHAHGVVHRDIKPDNVMLLAGDRVKVVDFGLAKVEPPDNLSSIGDESSTMWATRAGVVVGTTQYMSPEQASGVDDLDARSDLFSLGVVLYEMLSGALPFSGTTAGEVLHKICVEEPKPVSSLNAAVPAALQTVVSTCLEKQRHRRYASAADLAQALRGVRELLAASTQSAPGQKPARKAALALGALAIVAIVAVVIVLAGRRTVPATAARAVDSIAVLPLTNASRDDSDDYLADGITDELTSRLSSIRQLRVTPRSAALAYQDSKLPIRDIGRALRADAVLTGSVSRERSEVRVVLRLIDAAANREMWSKAYDSPPDRVSSLQSDLARDVAAQLRVALPSRQRERVARVPTRNAAAYEAYLHAIYKQQTALSSEKDADDAVRYAEQAVAADPSFAQAYVALAQGCVAKLFQWKGDAREYDEKAFVALQKALVLDPAIAEAYVIRGQLRYNALHHFDIAGAIADYKQAIELDPNSAVAHHALGSELAHVGLNEAAAEHFRAALQLDPQLPGPRIRLGRALWQGNRFAEAVEAYRRFGVKNFEHAVALEYLGRRDEAESVLDVSQQQQTMSRDYGSDAQAGRAFVYARAGRRREAEDAMRRAFEAGGTRAHFHHAAVVLAAACAELGDPHGAVRWLRLAASAGMPAYPIFRDNPSLKKLQGNAEYEQFMAELKPSWERIAAEAQKP